MHIRAFPFILLAALPFLIQGCSARSLSADQLASARPAPTPEEEPTQTIPAATPLLSTALLFAPHPDGDAGKLVEMLEQNPELRLTFLFPPRYFEKSERKEWVSRFRILQSSKQIEIGLTLDNEPILPLLADLGEAEGTEKWGFSFSWPDDVAAQIAHASGKYQTQWMELPSGLCPPYFSLTDQVVKSLKKFRLNWVVGKPSAVSGVRFYGGLVLLVPPLLADEKSVLPSSITAHPFTLVDAGSWASPIQELDFLKKLAEHLKSTAKELSPLTALELSESISDDFLIPADANPFETDFSKWTDTVQQKRAWQALAEARNVVETYKNSGRADLQRLDAAQKEILQAESGAFLLALGQTQIPLPLNEKNFLATLANVYRLTGVSVPPKLNTWFAARTFTKVGSKPSVDGKDGPFFVAGGQSALWNDSIGDDNGSGTIVYPTGRYPKGAFDLESFSINWNESDITLSVTLANRPSANTVSILPFADIYIDINRLPEAGSTASLRHRTVAIDRDAAWEFAVTLSPVNAVVYQSVAGGVPRKVKQFEGTVSGNQMQAVIPRAILRGSPDRWRLSVGVMGTQSMRPDSEPLPVAVTASPTERTFGGSIAGRTAPPFIDLLAPSPEEQTVAIKTYELGGQVTLPFVQADE